MRIGIIGAGFALQRRSYFQVLSRRVLWSGGFTLAMLVGVGLFAIVVMSFTYRLYRLKSENPEFLRLIIFAGIIPI